MKPAARKRIAIDVFTPQINPHCGMSRYILNQLRLLDEQETKTRFYVFGFRRDFSPFPLRRLRYLRLPAPRLFPGRPGWRLQRLFAEISRQFLLPLIAFFLRFDVIHFTDQVPWLIYPSEIWITIYDLAQLSLDRDALPRGWAPSYWFWRRRRACRRATRILTISHFSCQELQKHLGLPREKLWTLPWPFYPTTQTSPVPGAEKLGDFFLFVGELGKNKNERRILEAFIASGLPISFVFVTGRTSCPPSLRDFLSDELRDRVIFLSHLPAEQLQWLYTRARALIFVSLYEGFGLPILEAFAARLPVLTSRRSAMPEIAGDAALLVHPEAVFEIARAMCRLQNDESLRKTLMQKGKNRLKDFSPVGLRQKSLRFYDESTA